ncbi:MAG: phospholipase [Labilithrix sp.]|nr:phospholipase [Labilithrix sp.]MCW5811244.1 phospholipase [Labilithrix sp.]
MREVELEIAGLRVVGVGDPESAAMVVVLLHGFAMKPADLSPFAHSLRLPAWFLFPEGPLEGGGARAWWHIDEVAREAAIARGPRDFAEQHPPDLPAARARLEALVGELTPRVAGRPFYLGGFSQGAMLSFDAVLRSSFELAGLLLFSGSRIAWDEQEPLLARARLRGRPALVAHGRTDADLAFAAGVALRDAATAAGADVTWLPFEQGHEIPLVVWRTLRKMLSERA